MRRVDEIQYRNAKKPSQAIKHCLIIQVKVDLSSTKNLSNGATCFFAALPCWLVCPNQKCINRACTALRIFSQMFCKIKRNLSLSQEWFRIFNPECSINSISHMPNTSMDVNKWISNSGAISEGEPLAKYLREHAILAKLVTWPLTVFCSEWACGINGEILRFVQNSICSFEVILSHC